MIGDVKVFQRNPISAINEATYCRACGCGMRPVQMATRLVIQVKSIAFTPLICRACNRLDESDLIAGLIAQAKSRLATSGILATDYVRKLAAIDTETRKGE